MAATLHPGDVVADRPLARCIQNEESPARSNTAPANEIDRRAGTVREMENAARALPAAPERGCDASALVFRAETELVCPIRPGSDTQAHVRRPSSCRP